jgi:hypothetical protein
MTQMAIDGHRPPTVDPEGGGGISSPQIRGVRRIINGARGTGRG